MNWVLLQNSLLVSALTSVLSVTLGLMAALWITGLAARWQNALLAAAVATLVLPPFLVVNCWLQLLGMTGLWRRWLPLNIYSLGGTVWILTLLTWPIALLLVRGAWQRVERGHLETDPLFDGWPMLTRLFIPLGRPALVQSVLLTFVLALNNFSVPTILQTKVFPAELWVRFNTTFDYGEALWLSWPLVVAPFLLVAWLSRRVISWPSVEGPVPPRLFRQRLGAGWFWLCGISTVILFLLATGLPLAQLLGATKTWVELPKALTAGRQALWHSFAFAATAATVCVALGLVTWRRPWGAVLWLPFFIPGVLLGMALIFVLNRPLFSAVYQSAAIVVLGLTFRYVAVAWHGVAHALRSADRDLADAARLEGASGWQLLWHIQWPQIASPLAAAWFVTYLLCLWDVETLVLIVPPGGETAALRIFNLLHYGHTAQVNALCLLLLLLALLPWILWQTGRGVAHMFRSLHEFFLARTLSTASHFTIGCRFFGNGFNRRDAKDAKRSFFVISALQSVRILARGEDFLAWYRSADILVGPNRAPAPKPTRMSALLCLRLRRAAFFALQFSMRWRWVAAPLHWKKSGLAGMMAVGVGLALAGCSPPASSEAKLESNFFSHAQVIGSRGVGAGQFNKPRSVAVDGADNLYVADLTGRVQKFSSDGVFISSWQMPQTDIGKPKGMCRDQQGNIVVIEPHYSRVNHFSTEGRLLAQWGIEGTHAGQLMFPRAAAVNSRGEIYVSEYGAFERVQRFTDLGAQFLNAFGARGNGPGEFNRAEGLGTDAQDRVYVADSCNHRIQVFSADGRFLRAYGTAGAGLGQMSYPYDVCVDGRGNQFVCDYGNSRIEVFGERDRPLEIVGGPGAAPGQFNNPWAIALDSAGNLYVADSGNHRVQKLLRRP